jgi:hypothetical protein
MIFSGNRKSLVGAMLWSGMIFSEISVMLPLSVGA